jgi:hypothetical protein
LDLRRFAWQIAIDDFWNGRKEEEAGMRPGMPLALVLITFGIYVSAKYSQPIGAVIFLVGLVAFIVIWRRKNSAEK